MIFIEIQRGDYFGEDDIRVCTTILAECNKFQSILSVPLCDFPTTHPMISDKEIRLLYGKNTVISRKGSFVWFTWIGHLQG